MSGRRTPRSLLGCGVLLPPPPLFPYTLLQYRYRSPPIRCFPHHHTLRYNPSGHHPASFVSKQATTAFHNTTADGQNKIKSDRETEDGVSSNFQPTEPLKLVANAAGLPEGVRKRKWREGGYTILTPLPHYTAMPGKRFHPTFPRRGGDILEDSLGKGPVLRDVLDGVSVLLQPALLAPAHVLLPRSRIAQDTKDR